MVGTVSRTSTRQVNDITGSNLIEEVETAAGIYRPSSQGTDLSTAALSLPVCDTTYVGRLVAV